MMDTKQFRSVLTAFLCSLVRFSFRCTFFKYKLASSSEAAFSGTIRLMTRLQFCLFESNCCNKMLSKSTKSSIDANLIKCDIVMQSCEIKTIGFFNYVQKKMQTEDRQIENYQLDLVNYLDDYIR